MVQTSHRKRLRHLRVSQENIPQVFHVQVGSPAAASSRQPESSTLPLGEHLPCSSLALCPFSGPYLFVMSTKACTDAFTFLLLYLGIAVSSSVFLQLPRHTSLLPTLWATSQALLPSSDPHTADPHPSPQQGRR